MKNLRNQIVETLVEEQRNFKQMKAQYVATGHVSIHMDNCQGWIEALQYVLGLIEKEDSQ